MQVSRRQLLIGGLGVGAALLTGGILAAEDGQGGAARVGRVLVYGATPSGVAAAIAVARQGVGVTLAMGESPVGGMMTNGLSHSDVGNKGAIGGLALEFFNRVGKEYGMDVAVFDFEPHVASTVFRAMLRDSSITPVDGIAEHIRRTGPVAEAVRFTSGREQSADMFIDASYEGALLALAGLSTAVGRESRAQYGESVAGVGGGLRTYAVSAYDKSGKLDPAVFPASSAAVGEADSKLPAYNYRLCLSGQEDRIPFDRPEGYDAADFALIPRALASRPFSLNVTPLPNGKFDMNGGENLLDTDYVGPNWDYPRTNLNGRRRIAHDALLYTRGYLHFLSTDTSVPSSVRSLVSRMGLAADEFTSTGGLPQQLYVRESRRLVGEYVMVQNDVSTTAHATKSDSIGLGSYPVDIHTVDRYLSHDGQVIVDGPLLTKVGGSGLYEIPWRVLLPKVAECRNLLASVCVSASHVAWSSLRVEPQFMIMGEAAGTAAALAVKHKTTLRALDVRLLQSTLEAYGGRTRPPGSANPEV